MSEAHLQQAVTQLATWLGLGWWHDTDSRKNRSGLPDLIITGRARDGRVAILWRELKRHDGTLRPAQQAWGDCLIAAGADWAVWRPADLASGRIRSELEAIR
jgi:hypothetical protein